MRASDGAWDWRRACCRRTSGRTCRACARWALPGSDADVIRAAGKASPVAAGECVFRFGDVDGQCRDRLAFGRHRRRARAPDAGQSFLPLPSRHRDADHVARAAGASSPTRRSSRCTMPVPFRDIRRRGRGQSLPPRRIARRARGRDVRLWQIGLREGDRSEIRARARRWRPSHIVATQHKLWRGGGAVLVQQAAQGDRCGRLPQRCRRGFQRQRADVSRARRSSRRRRLLEGLRRACGASGFEPVLLEAGGDELEPRRGRQILPVQLADRVPARRRHGADPAARGGRDAAARRRMSTACWRPTGRSARRTISTCASRCAMAAGRRACGCASC